MTWTKFIKKKKNLKEYLKGVGNVWVIAKEKWQMHSAHAKQVKVQVN